MYKVYLADRMKAEVVDGDLQLFFPFPDDYDVAVSNHHPLDNNMKKISSKFIVASKNKLCQKGDNND
jgi:hypothetical protein